MTSRRVRKCESVPAPPHESARPVGMAGVVGPGLGPRRCGGRDMLIPTTAINTCATPCRPPRAPLSLWSDLRVPSSAQWCGHPQPHVPATSPPLGHPTARQSTTPRKTECVPTKHNTTQTANRTRHKTRSGARRHHTVSKGGGGWGALPATARGGGAHNTSGKQAAPHQEQQGEQGGYHRHALQTPCPPHQSRGHAIIPRGVQPPLRN